MVVNRFADLTPMEFSQKFTNLYKSNEKIKGYTKNLIDSHHFFDPTNNLTIN